MSTQKQARTGLLLILVAGPLLVFLFLYLFGENQFEIDRFPVSLRDMVNEPVPKSALPLLVLPADSLIGPVLARDFQNEMTRLTRLFAEFSKQPQIKSWGKKDLTPTPIGLRLQQTDTILKTSTSRGAGLKRLPASPRAFLFDSSQKLRGVYNITNSLSVDTLILEYKILTHQ